MEPKRDNTGWPDRFEESVECYDAAIDLKDNEIYENNKAETCIAYAFSLKDSGKYPQALDIISNSITIFKEISYKTCESEAYNLKGLILEKLDRIPEAFDSYKKAVEYAGKDDGNIETYRKNRDRLIQYVKSDETRCPRCGREIKITDNFCTRCGMKFDMIIEGNEFGDTEYSGDVSVIEIHEK